MRSLNVQTRLGRVVHFTRSDYHNTGIRMFFVRFALIAVMVAYSWSMGQQGSLNAFGKFIAFTFFFFGPALYLLPM